MSMLKRDGNLSSITPTNYEQGQTVKPRFPVSQTSSQLKSRRADNFFNNLIIISQFHNSCRPSGFYCFQSLLTLISEKTS